MANCKLWLSCQYRWLCLVFGQVVISREWPINYIGGPHSSTNFKSCWVYNLHIKKCSLDFVQGQS